MKEPLNIGIPCGARLSWDAMVAAESSERAPSEPAGPAKVVAAGASGSLPVSSAEALLEGYEAHAAGNDRDADIQRRFGSQSIAELYENNAVIWRKAAEMLRRHMASATVRQPEENTGHQPRA